MKELGTALTDLWSWYAYAVRVMLLDTWRALPGPWPVKAALVVTCLMIPGCFDEIALLAVVKVCRARQARRARRP